MDAIWWATEALPVPVTAFNAYHRVSFVNISKYCPKPQPLIAKTNSLSFWAIIFKHFRGRALANLQQTRMALVILSYARDQMENAWIAGLCGLPRLLSEWSDEYIDHYELMPIALSVAKVIAENNQHFIAPSKLKSFQTCDAIRAGVCLQRLAHGNACPEHLQKCAASCILWNEQ